MQISEYLSCMWYHQNYKIHILQLILRRRLQLAGRDKKQPEPGKLEEGRTAPATEPWSGDQHGTQVPTSPHGASVLPPVSWLSRSPGTSSQPITVLEGGVESGKVSPAIFLSHRSVTPGHTNERNPVIPKLPHWEVLSSWIQDELQASPHWHSLWLATHQPLHDAANPGGAAVTMPSPKSWQDIHIRPWPFLCSCPNSFQRQRAAAVARQSGSRDAEAKWTWNTGPLGSKSQRIFPREEGGGGGEATGSALTYKIEIKRYSCQESQDSHGRALNPKCGTLQSVGPVFKYWSYTPKASAVYTHTTPLTPGKLLERMVHAHRPVLSCLSHTSTHRIRLPSLKSGIDQAL